MDDEAKALWKRKNGGSTELPMILVDNERAWARLDYAHEAAVGTIEQLEEAVEFRELQQFLRLDKPPPTADADDSLLADLVRLCVCHVALNRQSQADAEQLAAELDHVDAAHDTLEPTAVAVAPVVDEPSEPAALPAEVAELDPLAPYQPTSDAAAEATPAPSDAASLADALASVGMDDAPSQAAFPTVSKPVESVEPAK